MHIEIQWGSGLVLEQENYICGKNNEILTKLWV